MELREERRTVWKGQALLSTWSKTIGKLVTTLCKKRTLAYVSIRDSAGYCCRLWSPNTMSSAFWNAWCSQFCTPTTTDSNQVMTRKWMESMLSADQCHSSLPHSATTKTKMRTARNLYETFASHSWEIQIHLWGSVEHDEIMTDSLRITTATALLPFTRLPINPIYNPLPL